MKLDTNKTFISTMKPGQKFQFSRFVTDTSIIWQKKGTRTISRIDTNTKKIIDTYYFTKYDFGYCLFEN